ncbi:hypothetical protein E2542_SST01641 [Spatholobus suberectus]|nr:hypothetical protein E2542_SST01641 [Spatholobus suberectus]
MSNLFKTKAHKGFGDKEQRRRICEDFSTPRWWKAVTMLVASEVLGFVCRGSPSWWRGRTHSTPWLRKENVRTLTPSSSEHKAQVGIAVAERAKEYTKMGKKGG